MPSKKSSQESAEDRKPAAGGVRSPQDCSANERDFEDPVNEASDESFPASDPPAWTNSTASKDGQ